MNFEQLVELCWLIAESDLLANDPTDVTYSISAPKTGEYVQYKFEDVIITLQSLSKKSENVVLLRKKPRSVALTLDDKHQLIERALVILGTAFEAAKNGQMVDLVTEAKSEETPSAQECVCGGKFRSAEDYHDHLPCVPRGTASTRCNSINGQHWMRCYRSTGHEGPHVAHDEHHRLIEWGLRNQQ